MKRFGKTVFLLMTSMMFILSISMPVQAKEITGNLSNNIAGITPRSDVNYPTPALIIENNVQLRETPGLSGEVLQILQQGYFVQVNTENAIVEDDIVWYTCKYGPICGYVDSTKVRIVK